ncbi:MAG: hypothetical protein J7L04_02360, partial [Bacteroidales bacterium]|nr:hypothetical protein [Bacteroidales bacterium]
APLIDMLNKSEKAGIIYSADKLLEIRELRNQIAHEYIPETVHELVKEVIELYPTLQKNIKHTETFITGRNWI